MPPSSTVHKRALSRTLAASVVPNRGALPGLWGVFEPGHSDCRSEDQRVKGAVLIGAAARWKCAPR